MNRLVLAALALGLLGPWSDARAAQAAPAEPTKAQAEFFERKIRPVLAEHCYSCHSAQAEKLKAGLYLDTREGLLQGGDLGPSIVPGNPDKSRLIVAVRHKDPDLQMPPKEPLSPQQIQDLEEWVKMGAPDPRASKPRAPRATADFWAFLPPKNPSAPKVKNKKWPRQTLDYFVLADLEERKLSPSPAADKRTLIRRATFDLTGLPPKPADIDAFLADDSAEAFARVVDRLLSTPQFGERWGRHWLDVARYADSNGLEINTPFPNAWKYRDYVVKAFNTDKPYNQFIVEQLAGDLLPTATEADQYDKWTATGFLVLGPKVFNEPDREKLLMDVADEQIDVTTRAFLALTVSCARCHDHKFDPIPTKEYYGMAGIFKSTSTLGGPDPRGGGPGGGVLERPLAAPEKAKAFEEYGAKVAKLQQELDSVRQAKVTLPGGIDSKMLPGVTVDNATAVMVGSWKTSNYSTNFVDKDYVHDGGEGKGKKTIKFIPNLPKAGKYEVRFAYTPRENRATNIPVVIQGSGQPKKLVLNERTVPGINKAFVSLGEFEFGAGTNGFLQISNEGTRGFVVADAVQFLPVEAMEMAMKKEPGAGLVVPSLKSLLKEANSEMMAAANPDDIQAKIDEMSANAPEPLPVAMAVKDGEIQNCKLNIRGDPQKLGEEVPRGVISVLGQKRKDSARAPAPVEFTMKSSGRLELAQWIASPENPLTARVMANRIWEHLFGKGLVGSPDNFGALGEKPANPELLDHLALQLVEKDWSIKKTIRMVMLSSAYQMGSGHNPASYAKDPDNNLIWRMNRRRLEAEPLRDAILAVSGLLDPSVGGSPFGTNGPPPSFQPENNRRGIYLPVMRNDVNDMFQVFDFADPHTIAGQRHTTTAATQALFMMNSPFLLEASKAWAEKLAKDPALKSPADRVEAAYLQALGRKCGAEEKKRALNYLEAWSRQAKAEGRTDAALPTFCQALFASAEFRFLN